MSDPFALAGDVRLRAGRDWPIVRGHPWVYRGALAGDLPAGDGPVRVVAASGATVGIAIRGASGGSLALRMVARPDETWNAGTLCARLEQASDLRARLALDTDVFRLVHAEGDRLPGLVVDRYAAWAVVEAFEPAWLDHVAGISDWLAGSAGATDVLLRRGGDRGGEVRAVRGALPDRPVVVREGAIRMPVDLVAGQKTGFFIDQRENRRRVASLAGGCDVLNVFSYSGGFAVAALRGGARRAVNIDASAPALELAREAYRLNGFAVDEGDFVAGNAFAVLRELAAAGAGYDLVVVDPPAFVRHRGQREAGLRGYKDVNIQAIRLVRRGGLLFSCSCSALLGEEEFLEMLAAAAQDTGRSLRFLEGRGAGPDHPVAAACREMRHLKAWLCTVE